MYVYVYVWIYVCVNINIYVWDDSQKFINLNKFIVLFIKLSGVSCILMEI